MVLEIKFVSGQVASYIYIYFLFYFILFILLFFAVFALSVSFPERQG